MRESLDAPAVLMAAGLPRLAGPARVAAMPDSYPMRWAGRTAIVTLPQHVSEFNADRIYELLFQVINRGATELVADMTGTGWCDRAGALVVARVRHCAAACGTQLRLVVTAEGVRRILAQDGLDRLIPIYPSLENAVTATAAIATVSVIRRPGGPTPHRKSGRAASSLRTGSGMGR